MEVILTIVFVVCWALLATWIYCRLLKKSRDRDLDPDREKYRRWKEHQ